MKKITGPKFVRRANAWCVSVFTPTSKGDTQKQEWFSTEAEAQAYRESLEQEK